MGHSKIASGSAFVFLFIFANNFVECKISKVSLPKKNYMLLIPGAIYMAQKIMLGGRYTAIAFIIAAIFCFYLLYQYIDNWRCAISFKYLVWVLLLSVLIVVVFWAIKNFIGRDSDAGILEYVSRYLGSSYELFDIYLDDPPAKAYQTFGYLIRSFNKLGWTDIPVRTTHEFRFSDSGVLIGNVYTGLRNYYNDFGMIGVFFMSMLKSMIFTGMYCKI
ncbi:MAG: oligosaccharide repeat unit polymerase [Lachnospiraceae bacterium]|nr:oligosaccharide repeat unit polymerase [Lachnospiraceae bacterium]